MLDRDSKAEIDRLVEYKHPIQRLQGEVAELIAPHLMDMDGTMADKFLFSPGHYSGIGKTNLEIFSRGMFSHMVGAGADWVEAGVFGDQEIMSDGASQDYFEMFRLVLIEELYRNGWFDYVKPSLEYGGALGTDVLTITGDYFNNKIDTMHWHPGDCFIGEDGNGHIDRLALRQKVTVQDIAEMKDVDIPESILEASRRPKPARQSKTLWMYWKRLAYDDPEYLNSKMKWRYKMLDDGAHVYTESPMYSLPGPVWRVERLPRTAYGMGPGIKLYRDLLQSNKIQKLLMQEAEVRVNPPVWIPNRGKDVFLEPGSLNYVDQNAGGNDYPRRMIDVADMVPAATLKAEIDRLSNIHFLTDFFLQLTNSTNRKTTVEVQGMMMESGAQVTVLVDSFERNYLNPSLRRTMGLMAEQGRLPEPSVLVSRYMKENPDGNFGIRFIGPLAKARRWMYSVGQDMKMIQEMVVPIAQVDPSAIDYINIQNLFERGNQFMSGGRSVIRDQDEVDKIRADRQKMEMAKMKADMVNAAMGQAKQPEQGSPAEAVMNG